MVEVKREVRRGKEEGWNGKRVVIEEGGGRWRVGRRRQEEIKEREGREWWN